MSYADKSVYFMPKNPVIVRYNNMPTMRVHGVLVAIAGGSSSIMSMNEAVSCIKETALIVNNSSQGVYIDTSDFEIIQIV